MKQPNRTATATVIASNERVVRRVEAAGPCPIEGCGGDLEIRHERLYGKVYTICPRCERRLLEIRQLRDLVDRLKQALANAQLKPPTNDVRESRRLRDAEIVRRVQAKELVSDIAAHFGLTTARVYQILTGRGLTLRGGKVAS